MLKLVRIEAPKIIYPTVRFTELEAGTLATCELCLFVLLYLAFASVESPISCELSRRLDDPSRVSSDLNGILRGSSFFTLGGVLKKMKKLISFNDN